MSPGVGPARYRRAGEPQVAVLQQWCRRELADFKPRCGAGVGSAQKTWPAAVPLRKVPEVTSTEGILHRTRLLRRR